MSISFTLPYEKTIKKLGIKISDLAERKELKIGNSKIIVCTTDRYYTSNENELIYLAWIKIDINDTIDFCEFLLKKKIPIAVATCEQIIFNQHVNILEYLLDVAANSHNVIFISLCCNDSESLDRSSHTFIKSIIKKVDMDCILVVFDYLLYENESEDTEIIIIILKQLKKRCKYFKETLRSRGIIGWACRKDDLELLKIVIKYYHFCDLYYDEKFCIGRAFHFNCVENVDYLLDKRIEAGIDIQGLIDQLFIKSAEKDIKMVEMLIEKGADVDQYGRALSRAASRAKNLPLVLYLKEIL